MDVLFGRLIADELDAKRQRRRLVKRSWQQRNVDKDRASQRKWREKNRERTAARQKRYRERNSEKVRARARMGYYQNIDKVKERWRRWYTANKDRIRQKRREKWRRLKERGLHKKEYEEHKQWRHNNKDKVIGYRIKAKYGISIADYPKPDKCPCCKEQRKLVFDHCHRTGVPRGWLCDSCNKMLGWADDEIWRLEAGKEYLRSHHPERYLVAAE